MKSKVKARQHATIQKNPDQMWNKVNDIYQSGENYKVISNGGLPTIVKVIIQNGRKYETVVIQQWFKYYYTTISSNCITTTTPLYNRSQKNPKELQTCLTSVNVSSHGCAFRPGKMAFMGEF